MDESSIVEAAQLLSSSETPSLVLNDRRLYERRFPVYFVLFSTLFERLAFYSLASNLVIILKSDEFQWETSSSTTASFIFFGASYLSSLVFAVISDAKLGRIKTIIIGFIVYLLGYLMIVLISNNQIHGSLCKYTNTTHSSVFSERCGGQIISILIFLGIGIGAVQVNMTVFGAEQFEESKQAARYFDKYYFAVNLGGTIATLFIPLIQNQLNSNSYFYGYLIAMFMLIAAGLIFLLSYRYYVQIQPVNSVLLNYLPVIINAVQNRRKYQQEQLMRNREILNTDEEEEEDERIYFLDYANVCYQGKFSTKMINDVKAFQRAMIVFLLFIPYWIIYHQMQITFPVQAEQMYIPRLTNDELMPISWISLGDSITILLGILILIFFVYKYLNQWNRSISIQIKLIIGMIFAAMAMFIAGIIEIIRQIYCLPNVKNSSMNILFQLPQNICTGLSEIFATIASLEYAYLAAPRSGQTLFMSLQFCSLGISSVIGKGYLSIYTITNDFDFSCLEDNKWIFFTYFFILAVIQIISLGMIILCERKYHILKLNPQQFQTYRFQVD